MQTLLNSIILRKVTINVIPFIQIFGLYVILNGHISPGGGFAGGTILGASLILLRIVKGKEEMTRNFKISYLLKTMCGSLIFYGMIKGYSFITGGSHIEGATIPLGTPGRILSGGFILPLNIAVGLIVATTVYIFFSLFYEGEI